MEDTTKEILIWGGTVLMETIVLILPIWNYLKKSKEEKGKKALTVTITIIATRIVVALLWYEVHCLGLGSLIVKTIETAIFGTGYYLLLAKIIEYLYMKAEEELKEGEKHPPYGIGTMGALFFSISVLKLLTILYYVSSPNTTVKKPIIYLYPEEQKKIRVKLKNKERITTSYPKYNEEWNILAEPNGNLTDLDTNKKLYSLYYESKNIHKFKIEEDGFVVKGEKVAAFLEEKLEILGLNSKEKEEFIIYWLPELEKNQYNYIRFATQEEIDENMPLVIEPEPQKTIRVLMAYKPLKRPIDVQEQELRTTKRTGYTAVEWGGTKI